MNHEAVLRAITDRAFKAVCQQVVESMARLHVPGVAVGVLHDGREHVAGFGVTHIDNPLPITPDTLFQIGSITKTFTATVVMRLVEQGRLELDTPLRTYLPTLRLADADVAAQVTMRHLLTHTGGWVGDYFDDLGAGDDALSRMVEKVAELPQVTPLGALYSYNNAGFCLAGRVIEAVMGQPYEAVVRDLVLAPLGVGTSCFFPAEVLTHRFVVGHQVVEDIPAVAQPWDIGRAAYPAGGLCSTVQDLLRYARFQLGDGRTAEGTRLLNADSLRQMQTALVPTGDRGAAVGLSWHLREVGGERLVGHGGGTNGQITTLELLPAHTFALVVLTNASCGDELLREVTRVAYRQYFDLEDPEPTPMQVEADVLQQYVGRYRTPMAVIEIRRSDGGLELHYLPQGGFPRKDSPPQPAPLPAPLVLYAEDRVFVPEGAWKGARFEFLRTAAGEIAWLRAGRIHVREPDNGTGEPPATITDRPAADGE